MGLLSKKKKREGDFLLAYLVLVLCFIGIIAVFSASYYKGVSKSGDPYEYLIDDVKWKALGAVVFLIAARFNYRNYQKVLSYIALAIGIVLLVALLVLPDTYTVSLNNAKRWIKVGPVTAMPGEIIKTCLIFSVSAFFANDIKRIRSFTKGILPVFILTAGVFVLILKQPNLSTAGTAVLIVLGIMFTAGLPIGYLLLGGIAGGGGLAFVLMFTEKGEYMLERVITMLDPFKDMLGSGYQPVQALLALGSGGIFGAGIGKSVQKLLYLPEPQSDYILAIIGEETGYFGLLVLLLIYLMLIWRCMRVCVMTRDLYGKLLASGITIHLALQVIFNVAVVSATFPPTGVVLPFISLGGNATLLYLFEMGVIFNISRQIDTTEDIK